MNQRFSLAKTSGATIDRWRMLSAFHAVAIVAGSFTAERNNRPSSVRSARSEAGTRPGSVRTSRATPLRRLACRSP